MSLAIHLPVRKSVNLEFDENTIRGLCAGVSVAHLGINVEQWSGPNNGRARVFTAIGFVGQIEVTVNGSEPGVDPNQAVAFINVSLASASKEPDGNPDVLAPVGVEKAVTVVWDKNVIHGKNVVLSVDGVEQTVVPNTGKGVVFVPIGYSGPAAVTATGSHQGHQTATITVP